MNFKQLSCQIKTSDEAMEFEGYGSTFGNIDRVGDIVVAGAFKDTLPAFVEKGLFLWQHSSREPVAKPKKAQEDAKGLFVMGKISDTATGRDAYTLMKDGVIQSMSIGFDVLDAEKLTPENIGSYCSTDGVDMHRLELAFRWGYALKKIELYEISLVSVPANELAEITRVKDGSGGRTFDDHSVAALAAVKDWAERTAGIRELRMAKGEELPEESRTRIRALLTGLDEVQAALKGVLADPEQVADPLEVLQARAKFLEIESRLIAGPR